VVQLTVKVTLLEDELERHLHDACLQASLAKLKERTDSLHKLGLIIMLCEELMISQCHTCRRRQSLYHIKRQELSLDI